MKIHLRFDTDECTKEHTKFTIFVNGKNNGRLVMSPDEADWFYLALQAGCKKLSPNGLPPIEFIGSGSHKPDQPISKVPPHNY